MDLFVIKSNGKRERFDEGKIYQSCMRIGLPKRKCRDIVDEVVQGLEFPARTKDIYRLVMEATRKYGREYPYIYGLRKAISELDPSSFEKYTGKILESMGYSWQWNRIIEGYAVEHQIDVIAEKNGKKWLVECKLHRNPHRDCGLGVALQNQARLEDILEGLQYGRGYGFDGAWIFTNTKFSLHAVKYSEVRGIRLTGWKHVGENSLERIAHKNRVAPITMLVQDPRKRRRLLSRGIITIRDFLESNIKIDSRRELERIGEEILRRLS